MRATACERDNSVDPSERGRHTNWSMPRLAARTSGRFSRPEARREKASMFEMSNS